MVHTQGQLPGATAATPSIAGGFVRVEVASLMLAWRACRSRPLGIGDFRTWLACREMTARRCGPEAGRVAAYGLAELARLVGATERTARASLRRLQAAGLLSWSPSAIDFPGPPDQVEASLADTIGGGRGSLAVPRRMLRHLAGGARPALIATALGVLLRCLSRRCSGWDGRGRIKASWVAEAFHLSLRQVQAARKELIALGWIRPEEAEQWALNRWGRAYRIDLAWAAPRPGGRGARSSYPRPRTGAGSSQPCLHTDPLREEKDQEPADGGTVGIRLAETGGEGELPVARGSAAATHPVVRRPSPQVARAGEPISSPVDAARKAGCLATAWPGVPPTARPATPPLRSPAVPGPGPARGDLPAPRLADVRGEDLKDTGRLLELHGQAVARGLVTVSEADRLRFVGAAEHALGIGRANPAGLFIYLVRGKLWRYLTQEDEDRASVRIKEFLKGPERSVMASMFPRGLEKSAMTSSCRPPAGPVLSEDARTVMRVRSALAAAGYHGDPFPQVRRQYPSWTRERWDRALAELGPV
jgi:hypothetical protein